MMLRTSLALIVAPFVVALSLGCSSAQGGDAAEKEPGADLNPVDETQGADALTAESVVGNVSVGTQLKTTADLRLRTSPSTSASIITTMAAGTVVTAVEGAPRSGWYHVKDGGQTGWSYGAYLDKVGGGSPPPSGGGGLSCSRLQWWNSYITYEHMSYGWHDTDLGVSHGTAVQLRHASRLDKHGVYGWGWMPEFTDLVTGERFRFLHLLPTDRYTTSIGTVYQAGTIVGLSGGDTYATGLGTYSTGAHLCVQSLASYRSLFPAGHDACH